LNAPLAHGWRRAQRGLPTGRSTPPSPGSRRLDRNGTWSRGGFQPCRDSAAPSPASPSSRWCSAPVLWWSARASAPGRLGPEGEALGAIVVAKPGTGLRDQWLPLVARLAVALGVGALIAGLLAWWLSRKITGPVLALSFAAALAVVVAGLPARQDFALHATAWRACCKSCIEVTTFQLFLPRWSRRIAGAGVARSNSWMR